MRLCSIIIDVIVIFVRQKLMIDLDDHDRVIAVERFGFKGDAVLQSQRLESSKDIRLHGILAAGAAIIFQQVVPGDG